MNQRDPLGHSHRCLRSRHHATGAARSRGRRGPLDCEHRRPSSAAWLGDDDSLPAASRPARLLLHSPLTLAICTWPERAVSVLGRWDAWRCNLLSAMRTALRYRRLSALAFAGRFGSRRGGRTWPHPGRRRLIKNSDALIWKRALGRTNGAQWRPTGCLGGRACFMLAWGWLRRVKPPTASGLSHFPHRPANSAWAHRTRKAADTNLKKRSTLADLRQRFEQLQSRI